MTPLQLQKYSDLKKQYKKDIILNSANAKKAELYCQKVNEAKSIAVKSFELVISNRMKIFFYSL